MFERMANALEGCLTKLSHIESRKMRENMKGHEFIRVWMQHIAEFDPALDENWLRSWLRLPPLLRSPPR